MLPKRFIEPAVNAIWSSILNVAYGEMLLRTSHATAGERVLMRSVIATMTPMSVVLLMLMLLVMVVICLVLEFVVVQIHAHSILLVACAVHYAMLALMVTLTVHVVCTVSGRLRRR